MANIHVLFFRMRLREYRLTNLKKLTLLGKVVKIGHYQGQQSGGAMSLQPWKNASAIMRDTFLSHLIFPPLKLSCLSIFCPLKQHSGIYIYIYVCIFYIYLYFKGSKGNILMEANLSLHSYLEDINGTTVIGHQKLSVLLER